MLRRPLILTFRHKYVVKMSLLFSYAYLIYLAIPLNYFPYAKCYFPTSISLKLLLGEETSLIYPVLADLLAMK